MLALRPKFNDALNDAVSEIDQHMLTINSCNAAEHYNRWGKLSQKAKEEYWFELEELIEMFDIEKIKLLPNPKQNAKVKKSSDTPSFFRKPRLDGGHRLPPLKSDRHHCY